LREYKQNPDYLVKRNFSLKNLQSGPVFKRAVPRLILKNQAKTVL